MKWIILIIVVVAFGFWLSRGRQKNAPSDPDAKTVEQKDYYLSPEEESEHRNTSDVQEQSQRDDDKRN